MKPGKTNKQTRTVSIGYRYLGTGYKDSRYLKARYKDPRYLRTAIQVLKNKYFKNPSVHLTLLDETWKNKQTNK